MNIATKTAHAMVFAVLLLAGNGCITDLSSRIAPGKSVDNLGRIYVEDRGTNDGDLEDMIADRFTTMGYQASAGPKAQMPPGTETLVTYEDDWFWDIVMYLRELKVQLREPENRKLIATGRSYRTSFARKPPKLMVEEVLNEILNNSGKQTASAASK